MIYSIKSNKTDHGTEASRHVRAVSFSQSNEIYSSTVIALFLTNQIEGSSRDYKMKLFGD
jgi:hypothetical protein